MLKYLIPILSITYCCTPPQSNDSLNSDPLKFSFDESFKPFYHGVASGDPLHNRVIIWTRVTPANKTSAVEVIWEVSEDQSFADVVNTGKVKTTASKDFTVKVDAKGLKQNTHYYYRFKALDEVSPIGHTKTTPIANVEILRFGVVSCSNYEWGYFNSYRALANQKDLDVVIHLGDYIYEYGPGTYGDTTLQRKHVPAKETISHADYRTRYSQYRLDKDLQAAHQNHAFIAIWDDHEIANNSYVDGAHNHQDDEGDYIKRREAAKKAYYEWMPVRESSKHYRKFNFGKLADLLMLDERLAGRTAPPDSLEDPRLKSEKSSMLGAEQLSWLQNNLASSEATWKIIGNQVIFSYLNWGHPTFSINLDSWDGYPLERQAIKSIIVENIIQNVVFVTGDTHSSWAFEVTDDPFNNYNQKTSEGAFAIEFGTTSINSGNSNEYHHTDTVIQHENKITNSRINPHLKYSNLRDHGFMVISLTNDDITAEWFYIDTVKEPSENIYLGNALTVKSGSVDIPETIDNWTY